MSVKTKPITCLTCGQPVQMARYADHVQHCSEMQDYTDEASEQFAGLVVGAIVFCCLIAVGMALFFEHLIRHQ